MTICCTHVIKPNDFRFNNCRKFSLKPQQFALVYLNLHNSPMRQHNTLGIFFQFSLAMTLILFDVLTLINIVKRRCSKNIMEKNYKGTIIAAETTLIPYLRKLFLVKYVFLQILCDSIL